MSRCCRFEVFAVYKRGGGLAVKVSAVRIKHVAVNIVVEESKVVFYFQNPVLYSISSTLRSTVLISSFCRRESVICEPVISIPKRPSEQTAAMSRVIQTVMRSLNEERRSAGFIFYLMT